MPCSFTYGATVVNFTLDPQLGDWKITKKWLSPKARAAGRENAFVYDKVNVATFHTLHWPMLHAADMTALITFLAAVDGISDPFDYTDPAMDIWSARIWNSAELRAALVFYQRTEITIELAIFGSHLTDESGNRLTDESGNHIIVAA
jgi:hypothetical protein